MSSNLLVSLNQHFRQNTQFRAIYNGMKIKKETQKFLTTETRWNQIYGEHREYYYLQQMSVKTDRLCPTKKGQASERSKNRTLQFVECLLCTSRVGKKQNHTTPALFVDEETALRNGWIHSKTTEGRRDRCSCRAHSTLSAFQLRAQCHFHSHNFIRGPFEIK